MPAPPWLTPCLTVADADAAFAFYAAAFGFEPGERMPGEDGRTAHTGMRYQGELIAMFAPESSWGSTRCKGARDGGVAAPG